MSISSERKEAIIQEMLFDSQISIASLAKKTGIAKTTLYTWRNKLIQTGQIVVDSSDESKGLSAESKFMVVVETNHLSESELSQYCREKGFYPEEVKRWRQSCIEGTNKSFAGQSKAESKEVKAYKKQIKELEKALKYKDKALAETAALLVLRKKLNALWGDDEEV